VPLVGKAHCDTIASESPKLFDQSVVEFLCPFAAKKRHDFLPAVHRSARSRLFSKARKNVEDEFDRLTEPIRLAAHGGFSGIPTSTQTAKRFSPLSVSCTNPSICELVFALERLLRLFPLKCDTRSSRQM